MLLRVERRKGGRYRTAMLSHDLLLLLRQGWKVGRQQGVMHRDGWMFPGPISTRQLYCVVVEAAQAAAHASRSNRRKACSQCFVCGFFNFGSMIRNVLASA